MRAKALASSPSFSQFLPYNPSRPYTYKKMVALEEFPPPRAYWREDASVERCFDCSALFSFLIRRHHCRTCGHVFCYHCCNNFQRIPEEIDLLFPPDGKKPERGVDHRICDSCNRRVEEILKMQDTLIYKFDKWNILNHYLAVQEWRPLFLVSRKWYGFLTRKVAQFSKWPESLQLESPQIQTLWIQRHSLLQHSRWTLLLLRHLQDSQVEEMSGLLKKHYNPREVSPSRPSSSLAEPSLGHTKPVAIPARRIRSLSVDCQIEPLPTFDHSIVEEKKREERKDCSIFVCGAECRTTLGLFELVEYMAHTPRPEIVNLLLSYSDCTLRKMTMLLPFFIQYLAKDTGEVRTFLIDIMKKHFDVRIRIYWWFRTYKARADASLYAYIWDQMFQCLDEPQQKELMHHVEDMKQLFHAVSKGKGDADRTMQLVKHCVPEIVKQGFQLPSAPERIFYTWFPKKTTILSSATRPLLLVLGGELEEKGEQVGLLLKNDDIRRDAIVMGIIHLMDTILKRELQTDFYILTYPVIPVGPKKGLIQTVASSSTLFDIKYNQKKTLLVWIMNHNPTLTVQEIRQNFVCSCAAFSVINYLLGVGDRHLKNVMITTEGKLFHVDYGYLMGNNPHIFVPEIRLTPEMVEVMGTEDSLDYKHFQTSCKTIYNVLRRHVGIFSTMLHYLQRNKLLNLSQQALDQQIRQRFRPGLKDDEAGFQFVSYLDRGRGSYSEYFSDLCYYYSHRSTDLSTSALSWPWKALGYSGT